MAELTGSFHSSRWKGNHRPVLIKRSLSKILTRDSPHRRVYLRLVNYPAKYRAVGMRRGPPPTTAAASPSTAPTPFRSRAHHQKSVKLLRLFRFGRFNETNSRAEIIDTYTYVERDGVRAATMKNSRCNDRNGMIKRMAG